MSDKTEFSFELSLTQPVSHDETARLLAFDDCKAYPLPDRKLLIRNPNNGRSAVIMPEVFSALGLCREFRTLDEHAARIEKRLPQLRGQQGDIRRVLEAMFESGLLVSADSLIKRLRKAASPQQEDIASAVVAIITWERPEALARLLDSIRQHADPAAISRLVVVDDTRSRDHIGRNQKIVADFSEESPIPADYFGRERQEALLAKIANLIPDHEDSLRFLADPKRWADYWSSGLARNFALLLSIGKRLVMIDDDALFQVYEPIDRSPEISFADVPREAEFFEQPDEWPTLKHRRDTDPVRAHLECLGLTMQGALGRLGERHLSVASLAGCTVDEARHLHADSPLLITQSGTAGDPGTRGNNWLIELKGPSRERMLRSEETVRWAISNHRAWVGRRRPQISRQANMSLITGVDNRAELPPYFPSLRGEDRLFGIMVGMLFPYSMTLDYPWASPHLPVDDRDRSSRETDFGATPPFTRFFADWVRLQADRCSSEGYQHRLSVLAACFDELTSMSSTQLTELYRDFQTNSACATIVEIQSALKREAGAPQNWIDFLQAGLRKVNADLVDSFDQPPIKGPPAGFEGEALIELWRDHWRMFGRALRAWPEIRKTAAELAAR